MLEREFDTLIQKYQPVKTNKFKQSSYIALFFGRSPMATADIAGGICRALSAAFIVRSWTKELDDAVFLQSYQPRVDAATYQLIGGFRASQPKTGFYAPAVSGKFRTQFTDQTVRSPNDVQRFTAVATVQKMFHGNDPIADAKTAVATLSNGTMPFAELVVCCPRRIFKAAQVSFKDEIAFGIPFEEAAGADIATSPPTPPGYLTRTGFWLISLNGHMVAAIVKPNRNKYRFFDPNNGILQWSDPTAFDRFMNSFTGREQIGGLVTTKWLRFG